MSVALTSKSGEFGGDNDNLMATNNRSNHECLSQSPVCRIGAAAACLALLLLMVILSLVAYNGNTIRHQNKIQVDLMECKAQIYNLSKDQDTLRAERDQLKINANSLTKEMEVLQSQYNTVAASRDKLEEDVRRLNVSREEKLCHPGWIKYNDKCYYASESEASKTWHNSRKDCQERRADLVIITTKAELDFIAKIKTRTWIGLSDAQQEGRWKWVDGSDLAQGFWQRGEPNDNGNEDCVEISRSNGEWNDVSCDTKIPWICED